MNPLPFILLAISLPLLLGGCGEKQSTAETKPVAETKPKLEGVYRQELEFRRADWDSPLISYIKGSDIPYTGKVFEDWSKGKRCQESNYKDGKADGLWVSWHENGQKWSEENWKDGKQDGLWVSWHENGQREYEENWKDGKQDGLWVSWHENGQKWSEENWKDGKQDGLSVSWHENGQKAHGGNWKDGKLLDGNDVWWHENGQKEVEVNYKDGEPDGLGVWWHENGKKRLEGNFKDGKKDGLWVSWHEKGQKESEANWKNDELVEGSQKWWDNKGNPIDSEKEAVDEVVTQALQKQQLAAKNPDETLYDATLLGETEKVKKAITEGADVNTKGALHNAVVASLDSGDNEIVEMFISNGANVNAKDDEGLTALDIIKSLSDIAAVSKNLRAAIGKTDDDIPVADLLRKHGAKTSEQLKAEAE